LKEGIGYIAKGILLIKKKIQFCDVATSHTGNNPQKELAKIGYISEKKHRTIQESCYILATCWNLLSKYGNFIKAFLQIWQLGTFIFKKKNPLYDF